MDRLTKEQAAIIGAYTGISAGPFSDIQEYTEKLLGHPVWTHEFASREFSDRLKELSKADFLSLCHHEAQ